MTNQVRQTTALARRDDTHGVQVGPISVGELKARAGLLVEAMRAVMKPGVHYGSVDGTDRKFLWKPGAEKLSVLFGLSVDCSVIESRVTAEEVYFRVRAVCNAADGRVLSVQEGACSTGEDKYGWREALSEEEFEDAEHHLRRFKFKKTRRGRELLVLKIPQVRRDAGEQLNTILQMAQKRAMVAAVRSATAASDIFAIEDGGEDPEADDALTMPARVAGEGDLRVVGIRDKRGQNERGDWVLFFVKFSDGREAATFNEGDAKVADRAMRENLAVKATLDEGKKPGDWKLVTLELVPA